MPITRRRLAPLAALLALALTACQTLNPVPPDPLIAELARSINTRASAFFLPDRTQAPDSDFEHNAPAYCPTSLASPATPLHLISNTLNRACAAHQCPSQGHADARSSTRRLRPWLPTLGTLPGA